MTEQEFGLWTTRTQGSRHHWTEDEIVRLNGRGALYYRGGEDGIYLRIHKDGRLEFGDYEGAIPHIGEAMFKVLAAQQMKDYNEAFTRAIELGGKQFLVDIFSQDSYLRSAELTTEQNYNMAGDGLLNNIAPPEADLTDGQTDEEIRELAPETLSAVIQPTGEHKPSLLGQVEQYKAEQTNPAPGEQRPHAELEL